MSQQTLHFLQYGADLFVPCLAPQSNGKVNPDFKYISLTTGKEIVDTARDGFYRLYWENWFTSSSNDVRMMTPKAPTALKVTCSDDNTKYATISVDSSGNITANVTSY